MNKSILTANDLNEVQCYDFSIQPFQKGKDILILICKNKEGSAKLMDIFNNNAFDLTIYVNEKTGNYTLNFHFIDSDIGFEYVTGKNETSYPPLQKLKSNQIKFITTGVWNGHTQQGKICEYNPHLMRFGLVDIGDSFKQASGVQFIVSKSENESSVVVLTYKDYGHVFETGAKEAYNRLLKMTKSQPLLEITPVNSNTINLRIWDILVDLDVKFEGLNYSDKQLKEFLKNNKEDDSFAFAIGFLPLDKQNPHLFSTKPGRFEIVTLFGYALQN
jgi:hypothetical protein